MSFPRPRALASFADSSSKICVAVTGGSLAELVARAAQALASTPLAELRLDSLDQKCLRPGLVQSHVTDLMGRHPRAVLVATCRRRLAGGAFDGKVEDEMEILLAAAEAGCLIIDLAIESAEEVEPGQFAAFRNTLHRQGVALMISSHDFAFTRDLDQTLGRLQRFDPDIVKLVTTAHSIVDNLAIFQLLREQQGTPLVAIAMGEEGLPSRVLGPAAGSLFTFAAQPGTGGTAPGQVSAATLRELYGFDSLSGSTRIYGVAGQPIAQSLSPLMQNTAFRSAGVDAVLLPLVTAGAEDLVRFTREVPPRGLAGVAVTMPLKQTILPYLDWIDPVAARVGACNTIVRTEEGRLLGHNTDVAGVIVPLEQRLALGGARVLVLGAGGAARAAVFGLREAGADVSILNRTPAAAKALAAQSGSRVASQSSLAGETFDVLLNATPSGMSSQTPLPGTPGLFPFSGPDTQPLPAHLVFDMVYSPLETPLVRRARAQGLDVVPGVEMFVQQGVRQFSLWTGRQAPEPQMRAVVLAALREREQSRAVAV